MAAKRGGIEASNGNVFADLGYADAKERMLKVELAMEVNRLLRERGLTQAPAAKVLGIRQPHVCDLVRYRLERFSVERLMAFIVGLGRDAGKRFRARGARGAGRARRGLALLAKARGERRGSRSS